MTRQSRADRVSGVVTANIEAVMAAARGAPSIVHFLNHAVAGVWENYLSETQNLLLLKKLFSSGRFELLGHLPP
ncbi:hypothetical protein Q0M81_13585, partial [Staphylococcus aureus]|nr:hypothetical protein [Staphylococcus aureus]